MNDDTRLRRRRLMGEGTVIVVSILLAFGIDALWTQQQERIEEALRAAVSDALDEKAESGLRREAA